MQPDSVADLLFIPFVICLLCQQDSELRARAGQETGLAKDGPKDTETFESPVNEGVEDAGINQVT